MNSNSIFDWVGLIAENMWLYGGAFLLVLGVLVFIHEWGHYIVARMCGVRVDSFSIGFGPELFGYTDKKGTRWKFSLVPLGGYVKMFGDVDPASARHDDAVEDNETKEIRPLTADERKIAFYTQPVGKRSAIVFAGPAINFFFAIVVLAFLFVFYGQPVTPPVAAAIMGDSAAQKAGFQPHDEIIEIDGRKIGRFEDVRRAVMIALDTPLTFTIKRDDELIDIIATPEKEEDEDHFGFKHSRGLLGVISPGNAIQIERIVAVDGIKTPSPEKARKEILARLGRVFTIELDRGPEVDTLVVNPPREMNQGLRDSQSEDFNHLIVARGESEVLMRMNPAKAFVIAVRETGSISYSTLEALGQMIVGTRSTSELGGIIRIGAIAGDMAKSGLLALISFTALLSINLGLINLFPIPMLDGGHLLFYGIEKLKGSPIPEQIQEYAFRLGLAILVGIMLFANLNDIVQLVL